MFTIPFYYILFVYLFFLLAFATFGLINVGHLFRTGTLNVTSFVFTIIFTTFTILTLYATWYFLQDVNWQMPLTLWNKAWAGTFTSINTNPF